MVKTAEWIYCEDRIGQDGWRCSKCKFFVPWYYSYYKNADFISKYHFCPKCGAEIKSYTGMQNAQPPITVDTRW